MEPVLSLGQSVVRQHDNCSEERIRVLERNGMWTLLYDLCILYWCEVQNGGCNKI